MSISVLTSSSRSPMGGMSAVGTQSHNPVQTLQGCIDLHGQHIPHGLLFAPGPDECQICTCFNGSATTCRTVLCAPPKHCRSIRVEDACCRWICLNEMHPHGGSDFNLNGNINNRGSTPNGSGIADVKLRLVASAVTAVFSLALLVFLIYRLRKKKLENRRRRQRQDDDLSLESVTQQQQQHAAYAAAAAGFPPLPPPPHHGQSTSSSQRSYWYSWAWWKPSQTDLFESRPAPPSYDDAMQQQQQHQHQHEQQQQQECSSLESSAAGSEAPPYSEIHLDPVIPQPYLVNNNSNNISSPRPPQVPCGAALVLPVPPPGEGRRLNRVGLPDNHHQRSRSDLTADLNPTQTFPANLVRMRARSRTGIVGLPKEERDAVLHRFSLQLNMESSPTNSSCSNSSGHSPPGAEGPEAGSQSDGNNQHRRRRRSRHAHRRNRSAEPDNNRNPRRSSIQVVHYEV